VGQLLFKDENSDMKSIFLTLILTATTVPQAGGGMTLFTGTRFGIVTGGDYRRNWHGLRWDDFTVYVGISFRKKSEE